MPPVLHYMGILLTLYVLIVQGYVQGSNTRLLLEIMVLPGQARNRRVCRRAYLEAVL
jgi:hypothetical protein